MAARIFLGLSALVWLPYGIYCFLRPAALAESAGVAAQTDVGSVEIQAMYGGLQAGIGVLCALGALRPALREPALIALLFLAAGLALARLGGLASVGSLDPYNGFALVFEGATVALAAWLSRRAGPA
ncbi:MAG: DUF4345 family protein [Myxococcota bacterium]